ncbi:IS21 family transposase [Actinoplanes sp. TBRC 11911]|nr:IS21 family transposase [Actinoplanes sp. TBRC 11911]
MARRTFDVVDVTEIFIHWYAGRSISELSVSLGVDRKTIRKYLAPAVAAGMAPGGAVMSQQDWADLVTRWFPQLADTRLRQVTWPQIAVFHDYIAEHLKAGVTQATIHQRLRDEHGLTASLASLKRYVAANMAEQVRRDRVVVLRDEADVVPGEEAQIDYGHLGSWTDPQTGKQRRVWAFAMVLAASRHMFVRPVLIMDQRAWTEAHVQAFAFFGGVPRRLIPDNLRTGVDKPDLYDPKINRSYAELAEHYGLLVDPARARKPRDKARVERPMPYIRDSFWRGRQFSSLAQMQRAALDWCVQVAGARASRPLSGAAPAAVFAAAEQAALQPLPARPFTLATWSTATVGPDIHAKVGKTIYSVPWRLIGQRIDARETPLVVQIFHHGTLVATHGRKPSGKQTDLGHYPPEKIAFRMRTPTWCRTRAAEIGPACEQVIAALLEVNALFRLRAAQGVLGLAGKHSPARLEAACAKALTAGDPSYRTIKGILVIGAETDPARPQRGDGGAAAHLRGPSQLFADVIPLPTTNDTPGPDPATTSEHHHQQGGGDQELPA